MDSVQRMKRNVGVVQKVTVHAKEDITHSCFTMAGNMKFFSRDRVGQNCCGYSQQ